jgi:hypothetical protein
VAAFQHFAPGNFVTPPISAEVQHLLPSILNAPHSTLVRMLFDYQCGLRLILSRIRSLDRRLLAETDDLVHCEARRIRGDVAFFYSIPQVLGQMGDLPL